MTLALHGNAAFELEPVMDDVTADRFHYRWTKLLDGAMHCLARWRPCMDTLALWMSDLTTFYRLYAKLSATLERCQAAIDEVMHFGLRPSQCQVIGELVDTVCIHASTLDAFLRHECTSLRQVQG